jgi:hypothetical protein
MAAENDMADRDDPPKKLKLRAGKLNLDRELAAGRDVRMIQGRGISGRPQLREPRLEYQAKKLGLRTQRLKLDQPANGKFATQSVLKPVVADHVGNTKNRVGQKIREGLNLPADVAARNIARGVQNRLGDDIGNSLGLPSEKIRQQILGAFPTNINRADKLAGSVKANSAPVARPAEVSDALVESYLSRASKTSVGLWNSNNVAELFEEYDAGKDPPALQKAQVARLVNAWLDLRALRQSEDKRRQLDVNLAAAEHYSFARLVGALYGDPASAGLVAGYYAKKKLYESQGRLQELRADPRYPVLPATLGELAWGQKGLIMGLKDYRQTTGKYVGTPFSSRKAADGFQGGSQ